MQINLGGGNGTGLFGTENIECVSSVSLQKKHRFIISYTLGQFVN